MSTTQGPKTTDHGEEQATSPDQAGLATASGKILIVEDEQIVALELEDRLTRAGHSVLGVAASGEEAIEQARALRPELVLMDIKLQGTIDGIDAAAVIRRETDAAIVYLSAFADASTLQRAKVTQPHGYILKPFNERELQVVLEVSLYRQRAEHALRESELWRLTLLRSVGDAVIATDTARRVKFMNPNAEKLTGWTAAEAAGAPFEDVFETIEARERRTGAWNDLTSTNLVRKDGSRCPIELELTTIRDVDPRSAPMGMVCVFRDVTERQHIRDRQRFLAEASSELSSSLDRDVLLSRIAALTVQWADWCAIHLADNRGALEVGAFAHRDPSKHLEVTRLAGTTVRGQDTTEIASVVRTGVPLLKNHIAAADWTARTLGIAPPLASELEAASAIIVPLAARTERLGTLTVASCRADRTYDESDVAFVQELARRVAIGIDNAQLYFDARRATALRDEVLAVVTHDLRNPLAAISLHGEQLLHVADDEDLVHKSAAVIRRNAGRMERLINDLLDVARIDAGRMSIEFRRVSTTGLFAEARSSFEALAAERGIPLVGGAVPQATLLCDPNRVLQVLANLLSNALKFSPAGAQIQLSGEMRGGFFEFTVADEGPGLAPDQIDRVFERYWQAPEAMYRGSGLGLYISRGIVEAHGGRIWVESVQNQGSRFHFTIPLARSEEQVAAPHEA